MTDRPGNFHRWEFPLAAAICLLLLFVGLGRPPLWDDDETRFASVAREMLSSGDWVTPRYNGEIADKPPLLFWAVAASFALFGESAASARVFPALASVVSLLSVWFLASRLYGHPTARWASLALATSLLFFAESRFATTDGMLLACVSASMCVVAGGWWDEAGRLRRGLAGVPRLSWRRALAFGVLGGLGMLCKGPVALLLPALCAWAFAGWARTERSAARGFWAFAGDVVRSVAELRPALVIAGALAVALPWHILLWQRGGGDWFVLFYGKHYLGRIAWLQQATGVAFPAPESHAGFPMFQPLALLGGLFPWSVFLPLAAWRAWGEARGRGAPGRRKPAAVFLLLWLIVWLGVVSLSSTQLPHYIFPAFPPACIMVASLVLSSLRGEDRVARGWLYAAAVGLAFGGSLISAGALFGARAMDFPVMAKAAWVGAIPVSAAIAVGLAVRAGHRARAARIFAVGAIAFVAAAFLVALPRVGEANPFPSLVRQASESAGGRASLAVYRCVFPSVVWVSGQRVRTCASAEEVARFLDSAPSGRVLIDACALDEIAAIRLPLVVARCRPTGFPRDILLLAPGR